LHGDLHELRRLTAAVERFCRENAQNEQAAFELNLVLEELFVNAVKHGGCAGISDAARIALRLRDGFVETTYRDRGAPFDLTQAPEADATSTLAERKPGGLGIHLVRHIMRDVAYRREDEWNLLTMRYPRGERQEGL
jgi:serine/threonine-protein kinase RsbW